MYKISCHNEWCSGPENWAIVENLPNGEICCPVCGWIALPGSGIKKLNDNQEIQRTESR